ncbi:MAG: hypothetical protein MJZ64_07585 [Paludibacteraceae bacterium]|nr:hypothetical protein [Paludibacteraceae bacterium]
MQTTSALSSINQIQLERYRRMADRQEGRLRLIVVLTLFSSFEWLLICMSYYCEIPVWLIFASTICVLLNGILIYWLATLYFEERKREKERRKQAFDTYKNR